MVNFKAKLIYNGCKLQQTKTKRNETKESEIANEIKKKRRKQN